MIEVRVFVSLRPEVRIQPHLGAGLFDDGAVAAIVEVGDPAGGEVALIARDAGVLDRLAASVATVRDELLRAQHRRPDHP